MEMADILLFIIAPLAGVIAGFLISYRIGAKSAAQAITAAEKRAEGMMQDARSQADSAMKAALLEATDIALKQKRELDEEHRRKKDRLGALEQQLKVREEHQSQTLGKKLEAATRRERELAVEQRNLEVAREKADEAMRDLETEKRLIEASKVAILERRKTAENIVQEQNNRLERISGMSREDAKKFLIENMVNEARLSCAQRLKEIRDQLKLDARREAQKIIVQAIQRTASDHSVETTVSVVNLASDDMKGRIIGREGRNIRAFEGATGVDVIVDDTPEAVVISGFDPFRREVARVALERLMSDGRIHPARIEEIVDKVRRELEEEVERTGANALLELGINNVHSEIVRLIGRMKYRSSYGQNVLNHSIEVALLAGIMARELGLDVNHAKRAGLMHDMGKCVDRNMDGPHAVIGYEIARRYREHPVVCNAIGAHHEDMEMESPIAVLVQAADAISGARPGARRESLEAYAKRLESLETLAGSFDGVSRSFAIQAGREIRVIVEPDRVDDLFADQLSNDLAARIQAEMEYPGQIKVTVIRERRSVAYAR